MTDARSRTPTAGQATRPGDRPGAAPGGARGGTLWWLAGVAAAFLLAQLAFVAGRLQLSWDEIVYISQVSMHAPAAYFDPARARGVPLLVAPVTLITSSVLALRIYLSLASAAGLLLALLAWRGLRPAWLLALAGLVFGGLWVAQYYGPQAMPDEWVAFSALAAAGLLARAMSGQASPREQRWSLAGLAASVAVAALVRPGDAVYLCAALTTAVIVVPGWRPWSALAAIGAGFGAGAAQWVGEASARFGGPLARLRLAGAEQGGFGWHLAFWDEFKAVNGPTLCRPCTVGLRYPGISAWWLALPLLAGFGVLAARRNGQFRSSLLAAGCGLALAFQYLFLIGYAAPRFLLPAYALLAIPAADALGWLVTGVRYRVQPITTAALVTFLLAQLAVQHVVLAHQVAEKTGFFTGYQRIAADLHRHGVRPPCLVKGEQDIPVAFYAGCASAPRVASAPRGDDPRKVADGSGGAVVLVRPGDRPPRYARGWTRHDLPGVHSRLLRLFAYVAPR
ncbi:MAG TPA: hypothetical protein VGI58_01705 [Streptosporangiaceae bacterium]